MAQLSATHDPVLSLWITRPLLQAAVIYSKAALKSSSEKSSTISKAVIFSFFFFFNQTGKLLRIFFPSTFRSKDRVLLANIAAE